MSLSAFKSLHFSPSDSDERRAALLNQLLGELRTQFSALSTIIGEAEFVPLPSADVTTETAFGQAASAGASDEFSRGDHTHGSPAFPTVTSTMVDTTIVTEASLDTAVADVRREVEKLRILALQLVRLEMGDALDSGWEAAGG